METFLKYLAVAAGGALGACLRYYIGSSVLSRVAQPFPTATFFINVAGSFAVGFFLTLAAEKFTIDPHLVLAVSIGFLGAFTTFSALEYETAQLAADGNWFFAFLYVVSSFAVGFAAVWSGMLLARKIA